MVEEKEKCKCGLAIFDHFEASLNAIEALDKGDRDSAIVILKSLGRDLKNIDEECGLSTDGVESAVSTAQGEVLGFNNYRAKMALFSASHELYEAIKMCTEG